MPPMAIRPTTIKMTVRIFFLSLDLGGRLMSMALLLHKNLLESCNSQLRERRFAREVNGAYPSANNFVRNYTVLRVGA